MHSSRQRKLAGFYTDSMRIQNPDMTEISCDDKLLDSLTESVAASTEDATPQPKASFIIANHTTMDMIALLEAFAKLGQIVSFIPKSSQRDPRAERIIEQMVEVDAYVNKHVLRTPEFAVSYFKERLRGVEDPVIIVDEGGYFAYALPAIMADPELAAKIAGVVEGTENGHQKYEQMFANIRADYEAERVEYHAKIEQGETPEEPVRPAVLNTRVISKARSPLKEPEDNQVGRAVVKKTDELLIHGETRQLEDMNTVAVIGLGKIGMAAALELRNRGMRPLVYDLNPLRLVQAAGMGFQVAASKEELLRRADLIISATGNRGIRGDEWGILKDEVVISSVTSGDDELDLPALKERALNVRLKEGDIADVYTLPGGKSVKLLNGGNSVNFHEGRGVVSSTLPLSLAEYLLGAQMLLNTADEVEGGKVTQLPDPLLMKLAEVWLRHFTEFQGFSK